MHRTRVPIALALGVAALAACNDAPNATEPAPGAPRLSSGVDENFNCVGSFTGGRYKEVFVPEGRTCTLAGAEVSGNILAREGARLFVSDTRVDGNIDGVKAAVVQVRGGTLGGSIQISEGSSPGALGAAVIGTVLSQGNIEITKMRTGSVRVEGARLDKGNIKLEENTTSAALAAVRNAVAQNLQVFKNDGAGAKTVRDNRVFQIVQSKENTRPCTGGPNQAGDREGQCV